jgi:uncharacterized repeat protein (TIGR04076 family)
MKKCRITVIKRDLHPDLAKKYCQSEVVKCPCFKEGDTFIAGFEQPEGFCGWAWNDIYRFVSVLLSGGNYSTGAFNGWMKKENEMLACCTDAVRPVTFKLELMDELSPEI